MPKRKNKTKNNDQLTPSEKAYYRELERLKNFLLHSDPFTLIKSEYSK